MEHETGAPCSGRGDREAFLEHAASFALRRMAEAKHELESLNGKGISFIPDPLQRRLRAVDVIHPSTATVADLLNLVRRTQMHLLQSDEALAAA